MKNEILLVIIGLLIFGSTYCQIDAKEYVFTSYTEEINGVQFKMVAIHGGSFKRGSDNNDFFEYPEQEVTIRPFYIGQTEVTQSQWRAVMGSDPDMLLNIGCDDCPAESISWNDAKTFINRLNTLTGGNYRLPTDAEWEYAACGGASYKYAGSDDINEVGWYDKNYKDGYYGKRGSTHPVGRKLANGYGLFDMTGNVWELCEDDYHPGFSGAPDDGSAWIDSPRGIYRVYRGGGWLNDAWHCLLENRSFIPPTYEYYWTGLRLAASKL
ncbi:MAG: formylglycine-generating enzyme family protein [Chitinophagales bacterium]|nr:formylglycine-generating enzyme family protein [Chitinophagales bacterium]